ncbi:hypothetical protein DWY25_04430 [Holdemania filiformis]|uniref:Uncharacterized protein n=1 Tax=Holdemania filiformis TaxID=61171 RepID=A0A412G4A4_9FIRM|nr:hypothetical protein [Holdemania filiformis]RGR75488.1 hypothetical protein DWY25_04430 [Holdemania filiformis]
MANESSLFGLDLKIDQEAITGVIKQMVNAGIVQALDEKNNIASSIVNQVLSMKVDDEGKVSSYSSYNKYTLLEYYVKQMIKDEAVNVIKEVMEEKREDIRGMIKREMSKKATIDSFYKAFLSGVVDSIDSTYRTTINVSVNKKEERY